MTEMVKRAEVGRFLGVEPDEVGRMCEMDSLPHTVVPGTNKPGMRIYLPDLHAWLVGRSRLSPKLADYGDFRRAFFAAQPGRKAKKQETRAQADVRTAA